VGDGSADPDWETLRSDDADIVRGPMGTVRLLILEVDALGDSRGCRRRFSGISSAGGISSPLAAAMIWWSAQLSSKSSSPRQNGAIRLSIWGPTLCQYVCYSLGSSKLHELWSLEITASP